MGYSTEECSGKYLSEKIIQIVFLRWKAKVYWFIFQYYEVVWKPFVIGQLFPARQLINQQSTKILLQASVDLVVGGVAAEMQIFIVNL